MANQELAKRLIGAHSALKGERSSFHSLWDDCVRYCLPEEPYSGNRSNQMHGDERAKPVDGTGIRANQIFAWGLFSNTYGGGSDEWFTLRAKSEALNRDDAAKRWLSEIADIVIKGIQNSNFPQSFQEALLKYAALGTGVIYFEMRNGRLTFREFSIMDVCIAESPAGLVDTVYREFTFTSRQAVEEWRDACHEQIRREAENPETANTRHRFLHAVYPRSNYSIKPGPKHKLDKRFASCWVDIDNAEVVAEGGYDRFPYLVPRCFKHGDEKYGRSPAMVALPDVRMLNRVAYDHVNSVEMKTNPPVFADDQEMLDELDLRPGGKNYVRTSTTRTGNGLGIMFYPTDGNVGELVNFRAGLQEAINRAFFADLFLMLENKDNMTATEVAERVNEKIQIIAPVISRLQAEFFTPLIEGLVYLYAEERMLPEPPESLLVKDDRGNVIGAEEFEISYTTRLDSKLAQVEISNLLRAVAQSAQIHELMINAPSVALHWNADRIHQFIAHANNVDMSLLSSEAEVKKKLQRQEERAAREAQAQAVAGASEKIKPVDLAKKPEAGSPLDQMKQQAV